MVSAKDCEGYCIVDHSTSPATLYYISEVNNQSLLSGVCLNDGRDIVSLPMKDLVPTRVANIPRCENNVVAVRSPLIIRSGALRAARAAYLTFLAGTLCTRPRA